MRRRLLGVPVDLVDMSKAVEICMARVEDTSGPPLRVMTLNPEMAMRAYRDYGLAECFRGETLVVPDGIGIVMAGRLRGWPHFTRLTGIDLLLKLIAEASKKGAPVFFYGGKPGVAERAAANLSEQHPGLVVAGVSHGFLDSGEEESLTGAIASSGAMILLAGLGVPKQENWLRRNLPLTGARIGMGVGGSLDVIAGDLKRAPALLVRLGFEWAYRLYQEPRRWKRLLVLPGFLCRAILPEHEHARGSE